MNQTHMNTYVHRNKCLHKKGVVASEMKILDSSYHKTKTKTKTVDRWLKNFMSASLIPVILWLRIKTYTHNRFSCFFFYPISDIGS